MTASGDEAPENGEDAETDREDSEDKMTVRPLEEEPEESTVVDTGSLPAAARNSAEEEQSGEIPDTMTEKEDTEEDESEELERSLAEAVGALLKENLRKAKRTLQNRKPHLRRTKKSRKPKKLRRQQRKKLKQKKPARQSVGRARKRKNSPNPKRSLKKLQKNRKKNGIRKNP